MATYNVMIGHYVRRWTTFTVIDPSDEELAALRGGDDGAVEALRGLEARGAAEASEWQAEENPDPFDAETSPDVLSVEMA